MRRTFGFGLAVAVVALALGCGKKDGPSNVGPSGPGSAGIEGGWTLVSIEVAGKKSPAPAEKPEENKIKATKDKLIATKGGKEDPISYKLDPSKSPFEIDLTETKADGKSETMYGIYRLEGDTLTICAAPSDKPADRPKEFKTAPGSPAMIMTLKKD